ncbi:hypothetical protein UFOVP935_12 [uncultured Caudovirales phage]|uniref:Bacteriophage P22, Gp10, DNA-stabilising n=1 Tax=uncultured Caudovirales phage TaxID=2100421 RepID=A0A6J5PKK2_9CAUD|nr:hypothetical protein UFOVP935_12 [uncultured Caudovirales phage]
MTTLSVTVAGQPFDMEQYISAESLVVIFFKSAYDAFNFENNMLTKITDADYPGWSTVTPTSITRSGSTATVTLPSAVNWQSGSIVTIAGAAETNYNGSFSITVTDSTHFDYTVSGTPTTPATGTITATGGRTTVPGVVYLDGYFFVMDENAVIYNCALSDPTAWGALDFITAAIEPGGGVALAKTQNYVVALKEWSTEFFYDVGNATGSPLSPVLSAFTHTGCASGYSVAELDNTIYWISKARQKGRSVTRMQGLQQQSVSTPDVDRILAASDLSSVYAYGIKISGHSFYVVGLRDIDVTLAFDATSGTWAQWTSLTAQSPKSCTLSQSGGVATASCTAHGYADGSAVTIAGADQSGYNGLKQIRAISANTFSFSVATGTVTPATGTITATGYDESYFRYSHYVAAAGRDLVLHETTGDLVEITPDAYTDDGSPIALKLRTGKLDSDNEDFKSIGQIRVIGDKQGDQAMLRWSDDDYKSNSSCRPVDLSSEQARIRRCGAFRRRSFELLHIADLPVQLESLEIG